MTFYHNVKFAIKAESLRNVPQLRRRLVEAVPYCKSANSAHWLHLHVFGVFTYFAVFLACVETLLLTSSIFIYIYIYIYIYIKCEKGILYFNPLSYFAILAHSWNIVS